MWLFLNEGVCLLKIPVLTTFLRTFYKLQLHGTRLTREKLVSTGQKPDKLSEHLKFAANCGLLQIWPEKYCIGAEEFRSYPNLYIIRNPSYKVWVQSVEDITDCFSYQIQKALGKVHSKYYIKKYDSSAPNPISLEIVTQEDRTTHLFRFDFSALGIVAVHYTKPICDYLFNYTHHLKHKYEMIYHDLLELFHVGDRYSLAEVKQILQGVYDKHGLISKAKATDLLQFGFKTKRTILSKEGHRAEGFRIVELVKPELHMLSV